MFAGTAGTSSPPESTPVTPGFVVNGKNPYRCVTTQAPSLRGALLAPPLREALAEGGLTGEESSRASRRSSSLPALSVGPEDQAEAAPTSPWGWRSEDPPREAKAASALNALSCDICCVR